MTNAEKPEHLRLAYDREGQGTPLVFVHGLTYDRRMWRPVIDRLSSDFQCVSIDLPAHGQSGEMPSYDREPVIRALHDFIAQLDLVTPITIGHSISGLFVSLYAAIHPTRGVITVDQPLFVMPFVKWIQSMRSVLRGPGFQNAWRAIEAELGIDLIPPPRRSLVQRTSDPPQEMVLGYWREALDLSPEDVQEELDATWRRIAVPFTAIFGDQVDSNYRSWLSAVVPQCKIVELAHAGHFPHLVDPERLAQEVRRFTAYLGVV